MTSYQAFAPRATIARWQVATLSVQCARPLLSMARKITVFNRNLLQKLIRLIFSRENVFAVMLCLIIILLIIVTADTAPQWIYQGF